MAQEWCVLHGVLSWERAEELWAQICKRKGKPVTASPGKPPAKAKPAPSKKRKLVADESDIVADTGLDAGSVYEGVGTGGI